MLDLRGIIFTIIAKVDLDYSSDTVTRTSKTGFIVYINSSLVSHRR